MGMVFLHEGMFDYDSKSRSLFCKYKPTDFPNKNVETPLTNDKYICRQQEEQDVNVDSVKSEWISLKKILSRWDKKEFPSVDQDENDPPILD